MIEAVAIVVFSTFIMINIVYLNSLVNEGSTLSDIKGYSIGELLILPFLIPSILCYLVLLLLKYKPFNKED